MWLVLILRIGYTPYDEYHTAKNNALSIVYLHELLPVAGSARLFYPCSKRGACWLAFICMPLRLSHLIGGVFCAAIARLECALMANVLDVIRQRLRQRVVHKNGVRHQTNQHRRQHRFLIRPFTALRLCCLVFYWYAHFMAFPNGQPSSSLDGNVRFLPNFARQCFPPQIQTALTVAEWLSRIHIDFVRQETQLRFQ